MQENITAASTTNNNNNRLEKTVKMFFKMIKSQNTINVIIITTKIYKQFKKIKMFFIMF